MKFSKAKLYLIDFANIFKSFLGANYLGMPYAFHEAGLVIGPILLCYALICTYYTSTLIINCKYLMLSCLKNKKQDTKHSNITLLDDTLQSSIINNNNEQCYYENTVSSTSLSSFPKTSASDSTGEVSFLEREVLHANVQLADIAEFAFGKIGTYVTNFCIISTQFSFCVNYYIFIGTTIGFFYPSIESNNCFNSCTPINVTNFTNNFTSTVAPVAQSTAPNLLLLLMIPFPLFFFCSFITKVRVMSIFSAIANVFVVISVSTVFYFLCSNLTLHENLNLFNWYHLAVAFGIFTNALEGVGVVIPVENSMKGTRHRFNLLLGLVLVIVTCITAGCGIIAYLIFGPNTPQILTESLPQNSWVSFFLNICLMLVMAFTHPLMCAPVNEMIERALFMKKTDTPIGRKETSVKNEENDLTASYPLYFSASSLENSPLLRKNTNSTTINNSSVSSKITDEDEYQVAFWKRLIVRCGVLLLQLGVAMVMRNYFAYFNALVGAISGSILAYLLPCAVELKLNGNNLSVCKKFVNYFVIVTGMMGSVLAVGFTAYSMILK